jgi:hypothetical protein
MPTSMQAAGANLPPSDFAPIHVNRMMTGMWSNSSPLRDAATPLYIEKFQGGRQDRIKDGHDAEISAKLTLRRRRGMSVYNSQTFPRINRFYGWNTFSLTSESVRVMVDTASVVYDGTGPNTQINIWNKSPGAGSTYFLGVGNTLYFTNGVDNKQLDNATGQIWDWGIVAPVNAPTVTQMPRPNPYPQWQAGTAYGISSAARSGIIILDDSTVVSPGSFAVIPVEGGGNLAVGCGQNLAPGASVPLPSGFDNTRIAVWSTPGTGFLGSEIDGVYQSSNAGGTVTSSFQSRSGTNAGVVPSNWIATTWDAASVPHITVSSSGGFTTIVLKTANGDDLAFVIGSAYHGTTIPVPAGFSTAQMLTIAGMTSADNVNHAMQGVYACDVVSGAVNDMYCDGSGNTWRGNAGVFAVFYKPAQGTSVQTVTNGTTLTIPTSGGANNVVMTFTSSILNGQSFGLPAGYTTSNSFITTSITGWTASGNNNAQGWNSGTSGLTMSAYYRDGSGNQWNAYGTAFAIGSTNVGVGGNLQWFSGNGTTGATEPSPWASAIGATTQDGSVTWTNLGPWAWVANHPYPLGSVVVGAVVTPPGMPNQVYVATTGGTSDPVNQPEWPGGPNLQIQDGSVIWTCKGRILAWADIGADTPITSASVIIDSNNYLQQVSHAGKSGTTEPNPWQTELGAITTDNTVNWTNIGPYSVQGTAAVQYGYAYENSTTLDISNMSPASATITVTQGNQVTIQGDGSADPQVDKIIIYRTAQGGSTFLYLDEIPNPGGGQRWTYIDNGSITPNPEIQAQVLGEGTPPPAGATCMEYHLGRIWVAAGNVVYGSSGPDAVASGSSGNAGFDLSFTAQSKVIRLWANAIGLVVFTVRDVYIILPDPNTGTLFMQKYIEQVPLLSYDAFTLFLTTPHVFTGYRTVVTLDPSAGIVEMSFPIADKVAAINPATAYCTFLTGPSGETALYLSDGQTLWYRMAPTSAPETGINWSPAAYPAGGMSAVQATEINPGVTALLVGPASSGPILMRDATKNTDNGTPFTVDADIGSIVLALPGQLAGLAWMTLEAEAEGTAPALGILLDEISGSFTPVPRTRQDPTNLPPSTTVLSNRHSLLQSQRPVWCRHLQYSISWPAEDAANELLTTTIFGQVWQEQKSQ